MSSAEIAAKQALEAARIPLWLGDDYNTGRDFLSSIGLLADDEAKTIIETIEKTDPGAA